jgi:hypothetical protein
MLSDKPTSDSQDAEGRESLAKGICRHSFHIIYIDHIFEELDNRGFSFSSPPDLTSFGVLPVSYPVSTEGSFLGVKMTTHVCPVPRLRLHTVIPPPSHTPSSPSPLL